MNHISYIYIYCAEKGDSNSVPVGNVLDLLPYRMVFAVASKDSILVYDTELCYPFAHITNLNYTFLTDLSW